jgi:hypothetical protein
MANWIQPDAFISTLEFFGANHRDKEIDKEQQRDDVDDDGFHMRLKFVAEAHVKSAHHEEENHSSGEDDVVHEFGVTYRRRRADRLLNSCL